MGWHSRRVSEFWPIRGPFEGLLLAAVCVGYLSWSLVRRRIGLARLTRTRGPAGGRAAGAGFLWMGYYNYRVTGHALEMPYTAHDKQYTVWSPWLCGKPCRVPRLLTATRCCGTSGWSRSGNEYQFARASCFERRAFPMSWGWLDSFWAGRSWFDACRVIPLWKKRMARHVFLLGALFYAGCATDARLFPHYAAPGTALVYLLAALGCARRGGTRQARQANGGCWRQGWWHCSSRPRQWAYSRQRTDSISAPRITTSKPSGPRQRSNCGMNRAST